MKSNAKSLVASLTLTLASSVLLGDVIFVNDFTSLTNAISVAESGSIIQLADGTYEIDETLNLKHTSPSWWTCELRGNSSDRRAVVLDGKGARQVVNLYRSTIRDLTVTNGFSTSETAGIYANSGFISNCVVTCCRIASPGTQEVRGGGVFLHGGTICDSEVSYCSITNTALAAHNVWARGGGCLCEYQDVVRNVRFIECKNSAAYGNHTGGALYGEPKILDGCDFIGCTASSGAGAVELSMASVVTNCLFEGNYGKTGGLYAGYNTEVVDCSFVGNLSIGSYRGGGATLETGSSIRDSYFLGNTNLVQNGGGIYTFGNVTRCYFEQNAASADGCTGGAIGSGGGVYAVRDCVFLNNSAALGAAFYRRDSNERTTIANCIFKENSATKADWGGIVRCSCLRNCYLADNTAANIACATVAESTTFYDNTPDYGGAFVMWAVEGVTNCLFVSNKNSAGSEKNIVAFNNPPAGHISHTAMTASDLDPALFADGDGNGNIIRDESGLGLSDVLAGDLRPKAHSILRDAAVSLDWMPQARDLGDGTWTLAFADDVRKTSMRMSFNKVNARIFPEGGLPDIGCFEYVPKSGLILLFR